MQVTQKKHIISNAYSSRIFSKKSSQTYDEQELRVISDIGFLKKYCKNFIENTKRHKWKDFREFRITFIRIALDDRVFHLLTLLSRQPLLTLSHLKFSLILSNINDANLEKIGSQIISQLTSLKYLSLNFVMLPLVTDRGLKSLISQISKHSHKLEALKLRFRAWYTITDKGFNSFGTRILKCSNLKSLLLYFENCAGVSDKTLRMIANNLQYLNQTLRKLSLGFSQCSHFTNDALQIFGSKLKFVLPNLEKLKLVFEGAPEMTEKGLEGLLSSFDSDLPNLKRLTINFANFARMTVKFIEFLTKTALTHLVGLTSLELGFLRCKAINDQGIKILAIGIGEYLPSLESLSLDFSHSHEIGNDSLTFLSSQIAAKNTKLKKLKLRCVGCNSLSDIGTKALGENLRLLTSLESFEFKTGGLNRILHKDKELLRKELDFIPHIQIE